MIAGRTSYPAGAQTALADSMVILTYESDITYRPADMLATLTAKPASVRSTRKINSSTVHLSYSVT